jgi:hypothetical protein
MRNQSCTITVMTHKFGRSVEGQIQQIMKHQNLPITFGSGTNPDRRSANLCRDQGSDLRGIPSSTMQATPARSSATASRISCSMSLSDFPAPYTRPSHSLTGEAQCVRPQESPHQSSAESAPRSRHPQPSLLPLQLLSQSAHSGWHPQHPPDKTQTHISHQQSMLSPTPRSPGVMKHLINGD